MNRRVQPKIFNHKLSKRLNIELPAMPDDCFNNALKALELLPNADYVEGYIVSPSSNKPNRHAWLEADGKIVDPSLPKGNCEYFVGAHRSGAEYREIVKKSTNEIEERKKEGPPSLTQEVKSNLSPHIQEWVTNPDYSEQLKSSIRNKMSLWTEKRFELEQAQNEAETFQKEQGWPT